MRRLSVLPVVMLTPYRVAAEPLAVKAVMTPKEQIYIDLPTAASR